MQIFELSKSKSITFDFNKGKIISIKMNSQEFVTGESSFFAIKLRDKDDSVFILDGSDFKYKGIYNHAYLYEHKLLSVYIKIKAIKNNLILKIKVFNKSKYLIEQVELGSFGVKKQLNDENNGIGEIYIPYNEGVRVRNMEKRENTPFHYYEADYPSKGIYFVFPNMISSQFISYNINNHGILLWMKDKNRTPKHIDFRYDNNSIRLQIRTFANITYKESYDMTFETRLTLYDGDYFDACEIYRKWFKSNLPNDVKTIEERYKELPKWYHDSFLVVTYPVCGYNDTDKEMKPTKLYPYTNALKYINRIAKKTGCSIMALLMQWESTAPWSPPYAWPPYGNIKSFYKFRDELHKNNHYLGLYMSGFSWTNSSNSRGYNKEKECELNGIKNIACSDSKGDIRSTIVANIRKGYDLCPSQEKSKRLIVDETQKVVNSGVDYVQVLDQNHGGNSYFCYSDKHGHVPAPGLWQVKETLSLINRIKLNKKVLLGCESGSAEPFISKLLFSDNRLILNQYFGDCAPMYSYIYHEYINNFMGNGICNLLENHEYSMTYRLAYSFLCGDILTLVIDENGCIHSSWCRDFIIDEKIPLSFIKTLMMWRKDKRFNKFLHLGKMIKPLSFQCGNLHFKELYNYQFDYPAVLTSAYEFNGDKTQFIVNYSCSNQIIKFNKEVNVYDFKNNAQTGKNISLKPLSVYYLE